ncbi:unnamed protein product [Larinioides sclopetarius]|uniref:Uncharacterized protein n=1 Tax=Larinioides sclopetarius TaxID=280406 RepID=A0AAV1ZBE6_9ARAC
MAFCTIINVFLLISVFDGMSAMDPPETTEMGWSHVALWKMDATSFFAKNRSTSSMHFESRNSNEMVESIDARLTSKEDCFSSEKSPNFEDCRYVVQDRFDADRLPQVISTITCLPTRDASQKSLRLLKQTKCEEVKVQYPVLKKQRDDEGRVSFVVAFETTSLACVRTVRRSRIRSRSAHRIFPDVPS